MTSFNVVLFNDFETLDALGPVEIIGKMPETYNLGYFSMEGGAILSRQQVSVNTVSFSEIKPNGVLLIPSGKGTRKLVNDADFISHISALAQPSAHVMTVCTGSALLAKTGLLKGKNVTSNKMAFDWVCQNGNDIKWIKKARWVNDGKYYSSSGVSAGMDMTLGFIRDIHGEKTARDICKYIEYIWNENKNNDPFAIEEY